MTTNEYEKAIEIAKDQNFIHRMHHVVNPDDKAPCKFKECTIAQAMLAMHEHNEMLKALTTDLNALIDKREASLDKLQADLKEALDVIRDTEELSRVLMEAHPRALNYENYNNLNQRAREFLAKHEGKG